MVLVVGYFFGEEIVVVFFQFYCVEVYCGDFQLDNQLYNRFNFYFVVLVCQGEKIEFIQCFKMQSFFIFSKDLEEYKENCFIKFRFILIESRSLFDINEFSFELKFVRLYVEDTFVYYIKILFEIYFFNSNSVGYFIVFLGGKQVLFMQVRQYAMVLVNFVKLRKLVIQSVNFFVSIYVFFKLYIVFDYISLFFSVFERGFIFITVRQFVYVLAMYYVVGVFFRVGEDIS